MQIQEMTRHQVTSRIRELLQKAQDGGGISPAERQELHTLTAKQSRDRAFRQYQDAKRPKVEQLPNARQNFPLRRLP